MKSEMEKVFQAIIEGEPISESMLKAALDEITRIKRVVHAARETRHAQKNYYDHGRTLSALKVSKGYEKELDKALSELWDKTKSADTTQERLL